MTTVDELAEQVALDAAVRVEQEPVAMILVARRLLAAAARHPIVKGREATPAVDNAVAAIEWAVHKIRG